MVERTVDTLENTSSTLSLSPREFNCDFVVGEDASDELVCSVCTVVLLSTLSQAIQITLSKSRRGLQLTY